MIRWENINKKDALSIMKISKRAIDRYSDVNFTTLSMDITAAHLNDPLDLDKLESFDDFNFYHDVFGIMGHINRTTGRLENCFLPRCSS